VSAPTAPSWRCYRLAQRIAALGHRSERFDRVRHRGCYFGSTSCGAGFVRDLGDLGDWGDCATFGLEWSVITLAFLTIVSINISMYRKNMNSSSRTGRSAGSIRVAAAATPLVSVRGWPQAPSDVRALDWSERAACLCEEPELFFPIGDTGPALMQIEEAKAVCNRCSVIDACLSFALEFGHDAGVWGGLTEDERRAFKHRAVRPLQ
jgi:WhiB family transcriptional regulator, redox-sensing transcriptional regulator